MRKFVKGIDASPGVAVGKVFLYKEEELFIDKAECSNIEIQKEKLIEGRDKTKEQLLKIREKTARQLGEDKAAIFYGHITLLEDEDLFDEVIELIE
ncbi:MAG: phosphoenolpyruvate-utilizing N-terminal domain-containing protein, partial [Cetobacterium sp.]